MSWELDFLHFLNDYFVNDFASAFFGLFTILGDMGIIWIVTGIMLMIDKKYRKAGILCVLSVLLVSGLTNDLIIKPLVARPRPYALDPTLTYPLNFFLEDDTSLLGIGELPGANSFASGHTCSSFAAATAIFIFNKKFGVLAYVVASLIAFSRLYFQVHYPTDVIAGLLLGVLGTIALYYLGKLIINLYNKKIRKTSKS